MEIMEKSYIPVVVQDCDTCPFMKDALDRFVCQLLITTIPNAPSVDHFVKHKMIHPDCPLLEQDGAVVRISSVVRRNLGSTKDNSR